jgi:small subunit ribosomal protein S2
MKALLETGVHFGHRSKKWNPKMKPYIFTERNGIHILDLQQTLSNLEESYEIVRDMVSKGGNLLFVGTKRQAQETIQQEAERSSMPFVNERWLGGTLTNWRTIRERIETLKRFERERDDGTAQRMLTKKERLIRDRIIEKLNISLGGLRNVSRIPDMIFIVDVRREATAVKEANTLEIPIMAMVDTNCDPDSIDYVIPSNDDAIRAIKLIASYLADAAIEGREMRKATLGEVPEDQIDSVTPANINAETYDKDLEDEDYIGAAALAKLKSGELSFDEEEKQPASKRR